MKLVKKILLIIILFNIEINIVSSKEFNINSKYVVLYNMNEDKIIYEQDKDKKISVASLTKIMTTIVAIENIDNLNKKVTITDKVFVGTNGLSKAGFKIGEKVTYYDLLYGAMLPSGADATNALAINIAGSINNYVKMMNEKAIKLNLTNTHFINTTGLDASGHYSTVDDIAKLLKYALKNETFKKVFTTKSYKTSDGLLTLKSTVLKNSNVYKLNTNIIKGSKTGFTDDAGLCMASITTLSNVDYLLVTCGANSKDNTPHQILDAITIYNYYNNNYGYQTILSKNQELLTLKVKDSYTKEVTFKSNIEISKYLNKSINKDSLSYKYEGVEILSPKNKLGSKVGSIKIYNKNELLDTYDLFLEEELKSNLLDRIITYTGISLAIIIVISIITQFIIKKIKD